MGRLGRLAIKIAQTHDDEEDDLARRRRRILSPERERLLEHLRHFAATSTPAPGTDHIGFSTAPGAANAQDRFGNWYYISDTGETWRHDPSRGEGDQAYIRMPNLDTSGRGDRFDALGRDQVERTVQDRVLREMTGRRDIGDQRTFMHEAAARIRPRVERELARKMRGRGASELGIGRVDDAQRALGQRIYFDNETGKPHTLTEKGLQSVDSRRLWAAMNPEEAARRDQPHIRRHQRMQDPRYWAAQRRLFGTTGDAMPDSVREQMEQTAASYSGGRAAFEREVGAHTVAREYADNNAPATKGMNYGEMVDEARKLMLPPGGE